MQRVDNALKMKDEQFKRILGTTKAVFRQMLTVRITSTKCVFWRAVILADEGLEVNSVF